MLYHRVKISMDKKPTPRVNGLPHIYNVKVKEVSSHDSRGANRAGHRGIGEE
jgi:hypothetical protein